MSVIELALLLCPREFREGYRRDMRSGHGARDAFDVARTGIALRFESLARDAAFALRTLRKSPLFVAIAVGTLALAISINAVVFAALNGIALKSLPFVQPQRLVMLCYRPVSQGCGQLDNGVIGTYKKSAKTLNGIAAFQYYSMTLLGHGAPQALLAYASSPNTFQVLGVKPELGTFFDPTHWYGRVVLSDELWRSSFGANPRVVGSIANFGGSRFMVAGVAPPGTYMPTPGTAPQPARTFWVAFPPNSFDKLGGYNDWAFARLAPGVGASSAAADVDRVTAQIVARYPVQEKGLSIAAVSFTSFYYADERTFLLLMLAAAFAVLLIACANVANLVLVRCVSRSPEFALRNALGATRSRILKQVTVEIGLLSIAGGAFGLLLAWLELRAFGAVGSAILLPDIANAPIDGRVVAFVFGTILAASLLAGVIPAILSTRRDLAETLKPAGRSGDGSGTKRLRIALGAAQVALAFAVIVGSGLLYRSFSTLANAPLGIQTHGLYYTRVSMQGFRFHRPGSRQTFLRSAIARIGALPGVESVAAARPNPYLYDGPEGDTFKLPGQTYTNGTAPHALLTQITPGYFDTLGVRMIAGRQFARSDAAGSQPVAIIDEHLARRYFGGRNPVGAQILAPVVNRANPADETYSPVTIVGVVSDVRPFGEQDEPRLYVPQAQSPSELAQIFIRMRTADPQLRSHVAAAVAAANPTVALDQFGSLQDRIGEIVAPEKSTAGVAAIVACIALLLALAGIYAIVVYSAHQQRHEFGIRMALGAVRRDIVRVVLGTALAIAAFGIVGGVVLAALGSRLISGQISNVSPFDPLTFSASVVLVAASVLIASLLPAFEASRLDPAVTLRYE